MADLVGCLKFCAESNSVAVVAEPQSADNVKGMIWHRENLFKTMQCLNNILNHSGTPTLKVSVTRFNKGIALKREEFHKIKL